MMGWFIVTRAILVRTLFAMHGVISIWLLSVVTLGRRVVDLVLALYSRPLLGSVGAC